MASRKKGGAPRAPSAAAPPGGAPRAPSGGAPTAPSAAAPPGAPPPARARWVDVLTEPTSLGTRRAALSGLAAGLAAAAGAAVAETAAGASHGGASGAGAFARALALDLGLLVLLGCAVGPLLGLAARELLRAGLDPTRAWVALQAAHRDPAANRTRFVARVLAGFGAVLGGALAVFRLDRWVLTTFHDPTLMAALQSLLTLGALLAVAAAGVIAARVVERLLVWWEAHGGPRLSRPGSMAVWAAVFLPVIGIAGAVASELSENAAVLSALDARPVVVVALWLGLAAAALVLVPPRVAAGPSGKAGDQLPTRFMLAFAFVPPLVTALALVLGFQGSGPARAIWASGGPIGTRVGALLRTLADRDSDGWSSFLGGGDCDDADARVHPGGLDLPGNGLDENCNGADALPGGGRVAAPPAPLPPDLPADLDVVLVTIDALRADHLGVYGYGRPTTPALDALAARGVRFSRFEAGAPSTRYNLPILHTSRPLSMLTLDDAGPWPPALAPANLTLAEVLSAAGVRTLAATNLGYPREKWGLEQGFAVYDNSTVRKNSGGQDGGGVTARLVIDRAIALLDAAPAPASVPASAPAPASAPTGAGRTFLWVHLYDPHHAYESAPGRPSFGTADVDRYDDEIANVDHEVARLLDHLRATGRDARTAVIVTSDHGEAFGEHGMRFHGYDLYDVFLHVPCIVALPGAAGARAAGRVVDLPAETLDVAPTILNLFSVPAPPDMLGRSLVGAIAGTAEVTPRPLVSEVFYRDGLPEEARKRSLLDWPYHVLHFENHDLWELYDLAADPGETHDLAAERPDALAALRTKLAAWEEGLAADAGLERIARVVLPAPPPSFPIPLDADLGGAVRVLGAALDPPAPLPGQQVRLTLWLEALRALPQPYRVFVHVARADGDSTPLALGDHEPTGGVWPTDKWRPRDVIVDERVFRMPPLARWPAATALAIYVGLYRGTARLPASGPSAAPENRVKVVTLAAR